MCWESSLQWKLYLSSSQVLGLIHPKPDFYVCFPLIFCLLPLAKDGERVKIFIIFSSLLFMEWRENGGFVCDFFFSLRSLRASFYWLCMHEHLCATSTIYVCIYAQWMHTTQGLDSQGLTSCFQLPPQEHSDKGASASSLTPSRVDFPASLRNTF